MNYFKLAVLKEDNGGLVVWFDRNGCTEKRVVTTTTSMVTPVSLQWTSPPTFPAIRFSPGYPFSLNIQPMWKKTPVSGKDWIINGRRELLKSDINIYPVP